MTAARPVPRTEPWPRGNLRRPAGTMPSAPDHEDTPMDFQEIRYDVADRILTITLHRPDRLNAWTPTMLHELLEAFDRADADDEVRAVIVTGAGRAFCAGADLERGGDTFDRGGGGEGDGGPPARGGGFALRALGSTQPAIAAPTRPAAG